jgi:hypothetical protein
MLILAGSNDTERASICMREVADEYRIYSGENAGAYFPAVERYYRAIKVKEEYTYWRGGRAVECTGLENQRGVKPSQGSNPCLSAIYQ